jgi:uncharacterized protein with GYD domain
MKEKQKSSMMRFAMLTRLSADGPRTAADLRRLERDVVRHVERDCPTVRWVDDYVVLGSQTYLDIFEAPDIETALKVGLTVNTYGHATTDIWPLIGWDQFKRMDLGKAERKGARPRMAAAH